MAKQRTLTPDPAETRVDVPRPENPEQPQAAPQTAPESTGMAPRDDSANPPETALQRPQGGGALVYEGGGLRFRDMAEMWQFSRIAFDSRMCSEALKSREAVFIALQAGLEAGLSPMTALQNCCVIKGKPSFYGPILIGMCRTKPDWVEAAFSQTVAGTGDDRKAVVTMQRVGGDVQRFEFSIGDARRAQLLDKDNWRNYPDDMLLARARGRGLKTLFSHHLYGISVAEEAEDVAYSSVINATGSRVTAVPAERNPVADLAAKLGVEKTAPEKPADLPAERGPSWYYNRIHEAQRETDLEPIMDWLIESHAAGHVNAAEANEIGAEIERARGILRGGK